MNSQRVCEFMSQDFSEQKMVNNRKSRIVAYPQNSLKEIAKIMSDIRIESLPVLSSPWDKKLVGVIELNKIKFILND